MVIERKVLLESNKAKKKKKKYKKTLLCGKKTNQDKWQTGKKIYNLIVRTGWLIQRMPRNWGKRPIIQYKNGQKILPEHSFMQHLLSVYYVPSISLTAGDTEVKQISLPLANLHLNRGNVMNKIKKIYILWDSGKALLRKIKQGRRLGRRSVNIFHKKQW